MTKRASWPDYYLKQRYSWNFKGFIFFVGRLIMTVNRSPSFIHENTVIEIMKRIEWEKATVRHMIELWCLKKHKKQELCEECRELLTYATARLDKCKFGERKTKCHKCPVHCYRPDMREKIREVMRFSGPRMILYHPLEALRYIISR